MKSKEVLEALDLCLECKACKTECPVGVDMARYKSEFLAQHYRATGRTPRSATFFGRIHTFARAGSIAPRIANLGNRILAAGDQAAGSRGPAPLPSGARDPLLPIGMAGAARGGRQAAGDPLRRHLP
jgi:Fe-S oxidoreductase